MPNCTVPDELKCFFQKPGGNTLTDFDNKNQLLSDESLQKETGYSKFKNGDWFVSVTCQMPKVTKEMVEWWFWWHPQKNIRYRAWFPGEHYAVGFSKKDKAYFSQSAVPAFKENTQYPVERIGRIIMPLSINFVSAENFGFSEKIMTENKVAVIVSGHVSAFYGLVKHTEMCHIFFENGNGGLALVSRFWLGKNLKNKILRKIILTEETARGMAEHCFMEYSNFAKRIPMLYNEYKR